MRYSTFVAAMFHIVNKETNGVITSVDHMTRIAHDLWFNLKMESAFSTPEMSAKDFVAVLRMYHPR